MPRPTNDLTPFIQCFTQHKLNAFRNWKLLLKCFEIYVQSTGVCEIKEGIHMRFAISLNYFIAFAPRVQGLVHFDYACYVSELWHTIVRAHHLQRFIQVQNN